MKILSFNSFEKMLEYLNSFNKTKQAFLKLEPHEEEKCFIADYNTYVGWEKDLEEHKIYYWRFLLTSPGSREDNTFYITKENNVYYLLNCSSDHEKDILKYFWKFGSYEKAFKFLSL